MPDEKLLNNPEIKKKILLEKLFSMQRFGIKPGLERTEVLAEFSGNPQNNYPIIHVAGTNGKGSVCAMIASILMECGYSVGLYSSPHIVKFNERMQINGVMISDEELLELSDKLMPKCEEIGATFFEITTAIAFEFFRRHKVDAAVIETGMGGRFDSTNIVHPMLTVITDIDMDHMEYLGDSIEKIAREKAGIIKEGVPLVISKYKNGAAEVIHEEAAAKGVAMIESDADPTMIEITEDIGMIAEITGHTGVYSYLETAVAGKRQLKNIEKAVLAAETLSGRFCMSEKAIRNGLKNMKRNFSVRGRMELARKNPPVLLDVSHNPASIANLAETLRRSPYLGTKWNIVFGAMQDKDITGMLSELEEFCSELLICGLKTERAASPDEIFIKTAFLGFDKVKLFPSPVEAFTYASNKGEPVLVAGSFYLLGELLEKIDI